MVRAAARTHAALVPEHVASVSACLQTTRPCFLPVVLVFALPAGHRLVSAPEKTICGIWILLIIQVFRLVKTKPISTRSIATLLISQTRFTTYSQHTDRVVIALIMCCAGTTFRCDPRVTRIALGHKNCYPQNRKEMTPLFETHNNPSA